MIFLLNVKKMMLTRNLLKKRLKSSNLTNFIFLLLHNNNPYWAWNANLSRIISYFYLKIYWNVSNLRMLRINFYWIGSYIKFRKNKRKTIWMNYLISNLVLRRLKSKSLKFQWPILDTNLRIKSSVLSQANTLKKNQNILNNLRLANHYNRLKIRFHLRQIIRFSKGRRIWFTMSLTFLKLIIKWLWMYTVH